MKKTNNLRKIIFTVLFTIMLVLILTTISKAASISISTSKSSVSPGESFTVTVSANRRSWIC